MQQTIDVSTAIDEARIGPRHIFIVAILALVTLFDGYDTFVPAYMIHYVIKPWHLSGGQAGLLVSSGLFGFMIGSLINGAMADKIGRKPILIAALVVVELGNLATAIWARDFHVFVALRVLTGIGLGALLPLSVTLVNEFMPLRATNVLVGTMMVGWSSGGILAALIGIVLTPAFGWPSLFWFASIGVPVVLACVAFLPESPRFLALHGRQAACQRVMARLTPRTLERNPSALFTSREKVQASGSFRRLLAPVYRRNTLLVWLCSGCSLFIIYGLSVWVPNVMIGRGDTFAAGFEFGALLQFMAVLGGVACGWGADRMGNRRLTLVVCWLFSACAILGLGLLDLSWTNVLCVSAAGFFVMGAQPVLNNLTAGLYATEIRSSGVGVELGVGRIGAILGPFVSGWATTYFAGAWGMFLIMAVIAVVGATAIMFVDVRTSASGQAAA